ncbi:MAG: hypothetical protein FJX77_11255, partial [Armatimonadetes bacterium]|nr:hypothetical protein [Armatimonadota bacterium]
HCQMPYVLGVSGPWGSGKTSFLRKLAAYLGYPFPVDGLKNLGERDPACRVRCLNEWLSRGEGYRAGPWKAPPDVKVVWFSPWHHQFEDTPLVALLHELREQLSPGRQLWNQAGEITKVAPYAVLSVLTEFGKTVGSPIPFPSAETIQKAGEAYESRRLQTPLSSEQFRDFYEQAIAQVIHEGRRLVLFIDDLDRCEGAVVFRLLEALKLYLNARNCVYVLGVDRRHLEDTLARVLSARPGDSPRSEELFRARDYLDKMFQQFFPLPTPPRVTRFAGEILNCADAVTRQIREDRFGFQDWNEICRAVDQNLEHNPRRIKAFLAAWQTTLRLLDDQTPEGDTLNWRLTLILTYLAVFEEPIYRRIEQHPVRYLSELQEFSLGAAVLSHVRAYQALSGPPRLEPPAEAALSLDQGDSDSAELAESAPASGPEPGQPTPGPEQQEATPRTLQTEPERTLWITRLVVELAREMPELGVGEIERHLIGAVPPASAPGAGA